MLAKVLSLVRCDLALDLGTVNTLVSVAGEGLVLNEPSVVAVERGTRRILSGGEAVGHLARQMQGRTPDSISVVRPLRGGVVADFQLCEAMLRHFFRKAQRHGWRLRPRLVVAAPGDMTPVERRALFNSALRAGASQVFTLDHSKAAALGVGLPIAEPAANMVCDIGGGATDVAVLSLAEIVASQSIRTAGDAFDQAIVEYARRHYSLRIGPGAAERIKIDCGSAWPLAEELADEINGIDAISGQPRKAVLSSSEIRQALAAPLQAIVEAIQAVVDRCGPDLAADLADQGLTLCGGGALLRGLDRFLSEQTGIATRLAADPLTAVARGTLLALEQFELWQAAMHASEDDV